MLSQGSTSPSPCSYFYFQPFQWTNCEAEHGSFFRGKFRRNFRVAWRSLFQVSIQLRARLSAAPADSTGAQIQEELILPVFRPVPHRCVENAALAVHPRPCNRIRPELAPLSLPT